MVFRDVLIVEDSALIALDLQTTLTEAGYHVSGLATTEADAVRLAREHQPDFVIVDINLVEGNGIGAALQIKRETEARIVFASAQCQELGKAAEVLEAWCVPKPYSAGLICEVLDILRCSAAEGRELPLPAPASKIGGGGKPPRRA